MRSVRILVLILCACFVSVAWSEQQACKIHTPVGWAEFHRYNMQRWNPCERVLGVNNVGNLVVKWSYATGGNVAFSSAAVASGVVYIGSLDRNVYALNASTGAKLWSYTTGGPIYYSSPAVVNGVVYVGSSDGNVYAFGLKKGQEKAGAVPALKTLHPDFNLKVSQPVATPSGTQQCSAQCESRFLGGGFSVAAGFVSEAVGTLAG